MYKISVSAFCGCLLFCTTLLAQSSNNVLKQIEQNNKELQAYRVLIESQKLENKTLNNLSDPIASGYYLSSGGNKENPNYTEFEISQSFEFPTVYSARKKNNAHKANKLDNTYKALRQAVLLRAQKLINKLNSLKKQKTIVEKRFLNSKKVFDQTKTLYDKEELGILDFNKAKLSWIQHQFGIDKIVLEIKANEKQLTMLNGGAELQINVLSEDSFYALPTFEALWEEKKSLDPKILDLQFSEVISKQQIAVEKNKLFPNITLGYNSQGVSGDRVSGVLGGISIPIWNSRNKVKSAKLTHQYVENTIEVELAKYEADYFKQFTSYTLLVNKFNTYRATIEQLTSEALLLKAYQLGEYSFMEYYLELDFYEKAIDTMLSIELELNQLKSELYKHTL